MDRNVIGRGNFGSGRLDLDIQIFLHHRSKRRYEPKFCASIRGFGL